MRHFIGIALACLIGPIILADAHAGLPTGPGRNCLPSFIQSLRLGHLIIDSMTGHVLFQAESDDSPGLDIAGKSKSHERHKHRGGDDDQVVIGQTYKLNRDDLVRGNLVLIGGTGEIDGTIEGDLVLIGSTVTFGGTVNGDLVANGSNLTINPGATANGDYVSIASTVKGEENLTTNGDRVLLNGFPAIAPALKEFLANFLQLRTMSPTSIFSWTLALIFLAIRLVLGVSFPKLFEKTDIIIRERTGPSFLIGLAMILGLPLLSVLLIITILGILALPFLAIAFFILLVFGTTAVCYSFGKRVAPQIAEKRYVACIWIVIGNVVAWVLFCIPVIGFLAAGVIALLGLGSFGIYLAERYRSNAPQPLRQQPASGAVRSLEEIESSALAPATAASESVRGRAHFLPRLIANLIDLTIIVPLLHSLHITSAVIAAWALYRFGMYTWKSATLGQIVLNLQVQKSDGATLVGDYSGAAIRALSSLLSLIPLGLGFIWILFNSNLEAWHDKISGTYVVRRNPSPSRSETSSSPVGPAPPPA
jgi:uncharacterized RDD family membrane protein YckC